jgi:tetratricopeptide (TPR) repeat protein
MDKSPVTPGAIVPAREMLGELLLDLDRPQPALAAFERALKDSPNRLNALSGAARAAQLSGDRAKARDYYARVVELLTPRESSPRPSSPARSGSGW